MDPGRTRTGAETRGIDSVFEALKRAAEKAEEAASRVEQHSMIRESLRIGKEESPTSTAMTGLGSTSEVEESQVFGHNQVALSAEETAAKVHAMVHQSMHTATEFAVPSRKTHTDVDQSSRGGFDVGSDSETTARADSKVEAGAVRVKRHSLAGLYPTMITGEVVARMGSAHHSPHDDIALRQNQPLNSIIPLTPDDSSEDHSQKVMSEPRVSSFDSDSRDSPVASTPYLGHTLNLSSNPNISSSKTGRSRKQNLIDMIMRESQQLSPEASVIPKKRGRPRGSKSSTHTKRSTGKLQNGESILLLPAGQHSHAPSTGPTFTETPLIEPPLPSTVQGLPVVKSRMVEGYSNDTSPLSNYAQSPHLSTSSTGRAIVSESSVTKVPSVTEPQAQLLQENNLLKTLFKTEIGPIMDETMRHYESRLPRDVMVAVGKAVSSPSLTER